MVLKYNIRARFLADEGAIKNVLTVENDVVPFDRADVLEQGCVNAFLSDSLRSPRPCDLLGLPIGFETGRRVPELPSANTFSLRSRYSERTSSRTKLLFSDGIERNSKASRLLSTGNLAALMRRSVARCSRSSNSSYRRPQSEV